jgi:hypothetical protein
MTVMRLRAFGYPSHEEDQWIDGSFLPVAWPLPVSPAAQPAWPAGARDMFGTSQVPRLDLTRHRFGVNYTPSHNWWSCWNDWDADPIKRDLDAIAALGADHLRIFPIWPFFQPNPKQVSLPHLERLDQLLTLMGERKLDALVTVFTGGLSAFYFMPPFPPPPQAGNTISAACFFTSSRMLGAFHAPEAIVQAILKMWGDAEELFTRELARTIKPHLNVIGFDLGAEIDNCWSAPTEDGDAWMAHMFALMDEVLPMHVHVNGVLHPWFKDHTDTPEGVQNPTTFSPQALAAARFPVMHCYPFWTGAVKYGGAMDPPSTKLMAATAALIRSFAGTQQKPVWAGEFNTCIQELPEKGQAEWLEKAVIAAIDQGMSWFSYWDTHDLDPKLFFLFPLEYNLGLLTNDGRVKEQGRVFKQLADAYRGKPVSFPKASLPEPPTDRSQDGTWKWLLDWMGWKPTAS